MITTLLTHLFSGWIIVFLFFIFLWRLAVKQSNAGWVDVGWSLSFAFLVAWIGHLSDGYVLRRALITVVAVFWGVRLSCHIFKRLRSESSEDKRYQFLRNHWGVSANQKFFWFFQGQGLANVLLVFPVAILFANPRTYLTVWDFLGLLVIILSVVGESIADRQLAEWKQNSSNKGKTCRSGLWAYSRHPNYFFEWCHWLAYPLFGFSLWGTDLSGYWVLTLIGPVLMYILLTKFTGIPYTEKQSLKSRGENYRRYQEEVSAFFPWFPKQQ